MALIDFGGVKEEVITRKEFSLAKARQVLKNETIAVIGYGVQGPAQSLNMRDNGVRVIIGQAQEFQRDWDRARKDGWAPGKTLFGIEEACERGTIIMMLFPPRLRASAVPSPDRYRARNAPSGRPRARFLSPRPVARSRSRAAGMAQANRRRVSIEGRSRP